MAPLSRRARVARNLGRFLEVVDTDMLVRDASKPLREPKARVEVAVAEVGPGPAGAWRDLVPRGRWARTQRFLARADVGYIAHADGRFVGEIWLSRISHRDPYSGLPIRLASDEAYAYALWVDPEVRPHGVAAVLMTTMLKAVRDDPALTRVYGWVDTRNRESQMLLRLLGFSQMQHLKRLHVLHRVGRPVPRSTTPAFGPLSRAGRHRAA